MTDWQDVGTSLLNSMIRRKYVLSAVLLRSPVYMLGHLNLVARSVAIHTQCFPRHLARHNEDG